MSVLLGVKQSKKAAKKAKKQQQQEGSLDQTPIFEQTIDLPTGPSLDAGLSEAYKSRWELNKAMREKRRKVIKEANFLRAMG